ncbi:MAG: hypothetical protein ABI082_02800 [Dokdonella sp.]
MGLLLWLVVTLVGFALAFVAKSAVVLGLGLLLALVGLLGLVLAMAAARVSASARPETSMASVDDLGALRNRAPPTTFRTPPAPERSGDAGPTA